MYGSQLVRSVTLTEETQLSFKAIKLVLTLRCEESTRLVSDSLDRDLTRSERLAIRLHAVSCWSCRRFRRQILFLREAIRRNMADRIAALHFSATSLSPAARDRIRRALLLAQRDEFR